MAGPRGVPRASSWQGKTARDEGQRGMRQPKGARVVMAPALPPFRARVHRRRERPQRAAAARRRARRERRAGDALDSPAHSAPSWGMGRDAINLLCADLPGAEASDDPAGGTAWTVGGLPFAVVGAGGVAVAAPGAEGLLAAGLARPAPGRDAPWVELPLDGPDSELRRGLAASYEAARDALPPAVRVTLDRTSG